MNGREGGAVQGKSFDVSASAGGGGTRRSEDSSPGMPAGVLKRRVEDVIRIGGAKEALADALGTTGTNETHVQLRFCCR